MRPTRRILQTRVYPGLCTPNLTRQKRPADGRVDGHHHDVITSHIRCFHTLQRPRARVRVVCPRSKRSKRRRRPAFRQTASGATPASRLGHKKPRRTLGSSFVPLRPFDTTSLPAAFPNPPARPTAHTARVRPPSTSDRKVRVERAGRASAAAAAAAVGVAAVEVAAVAAAAQRGGS
eukprot:363628-Chlamydomonas_euryale.AAC.11